MCQNNTPFLFMASRKFRRRIMFVRALSESADFTRPNWLKAIREGDEEERLRSITAVVTLVLKGEERELLFNIASNPERASLRLKRHQYSRSSEKIWVILIAKTDDDNIIRQKFFETVKEVYPAFALAVRI